jgi:hypothetical protein
LEDSLVEAQTASDANSASGPTADCGDWRSPQRSNTSYVQCLSEAVHFMLRARSVTQLDCKVISVALRMQFVDFIKQDLLHVRPDENGAKVIEMACSQMSYAAAKLATLWDTAPESVALHTGQDGPTLEPTPEPAPGDGSAKHTTDEFDEALNVWMHFECKVPADRLDAALADITAQQRQAIDTIRLLVTDVSQQVADILKTTVVPPPLLDLTGPKKGEQQVGCTDAAEDDDDPAMVQSYDMLCPEVEQVLPDPGQAMPTPPYKAVDLTQVPRRVSTRDQAVDALRMCDRLCTLIENQAHCIKNRKLLVASFIQHVMTTVVPIPKPRAVGEDVRSRIITERARKRRAEQCRVILVARSALEYRDKDAATAAAAAAAAAEVAAQAALAADATSDTAAVGEGAVETDDTSAEAIMADEALTRVLLDKAATATLECLTDDAQREAVFNARFVPTEFRADTFQDSGKKVAMVVGCTVLSFADPETAKMALELVKPKAQALGIVARLWSEAGSRFRITPPTEHEVQETTLPQPNFAQGEAEEEAMARQAECIWDQDITYGLQESLLSTLHRLIEHFAAAAMSIPQTRAFDAVCCVVPGCIAAIADSVLRRAAVDHPSAASTQLFGRTSAGKQLGLPGYGLDVGSFATQTATCHVHAPEVLTARTAVLDYFRSPAQRKLDKIYDWERGYALRPTRPMVKYFRSILRESANSVAAVEMDQGGSGISGVVIMLLSRAPTASVIHKDFPEFFAYRGEPHSTCVCCV